MAKAVKRRAYSSAIRQEQAAHTRSRILDAAGDLFETEGYGRTTVRRIAEAAGVATDTVYSVFGTKSQVLTALIDRRLAPEGQSNVWERREGLAIRDETDQRRQVHLFAKEITLLSARVRPVFEILRTASAVEPEMAAVYAEQEEFRRRNMRLVAGWIDARGPLRVDVERAAEIMWVLASPDVARLLCDVRGWSVDEHAAWLEETLVRSLLISE